MDSNLNIIYEDSFLLAVNKPEGLIVNDSETAADDTLQKRVGEYLKFQSQNGNGDGDFYDRFGIIHRLDKDTSGILLIAKDEKTFLDLQQQFKKREIEKEYLALVFGKIDTPVFEIRAPIGRNPRNKMKFAVVAGKKDAVTHAEVVREFIVQGKNVTLLKVYPHTGRTHQIRVHLAATNNPIVGDILYSGKDQYEKGIRMFGRMMLHAHWISFTHPQKSERMELKAPNEIFEQLFTS